MYIIYIYIIYVIDKLHTTEVITHTRGGYANRHRGEGVY